MVITKLKRKIWDKLPCCARNLINRFRTPVIPIPFDTICVSDLFIIPNPSKFTTYFELLNINSIVNPEDKPLAYQVLFKAFDHNGICRESKYLVNNSNPRTTISINKLIHNIKLRTGTFVFFHLLPPTSKSEIDGVFCERGYVGISKKNIHTKSYVHGNYDCIAHLRNGGMKCLIQNSLRIKYNYNIQFTFRPNLSNFLFIVNPTNSTVKFLLYSTTSGGNKEYYQIPKLGHIEIELKNKHDENYIIKSNCKMLRPIILLDNGESVDILHS